MNEKEVEEKITIEKEEKVESVTKPAITEEAIIKAIKKAGGKAEITPLYEAFDKTGFESIRPCDLKTKLRDFSKKMVEDGKIKSTREKRSWTFILKSSK